MEPNAVQKRVPIWVGGRTFLSLKRALTLGDGWVPAMRYRDAGVDITRAEEESS